MTSSYRLRLLDEYNQDLVELDLHSPKERIPNAQLMFLPEQKVYSTRCYSAQLIGPKSQDIISFELQINGYAIDCSYKSHTGNIYFSDPLNGQKVFANSFGLSSIWLRLRTKQSTQTLVSEYFQVMVRPGEDNYSVNVMGSYTAAHYRSLLYQKQPVFQPLNFGRRRRASLEEKMRYFLELHRSMRQLLPELERTSRIRRAAFSGSSKPLSQPAASMSYGQGGRMAGRRLIQSSVNAGRTLFEPSYEDQVLVSFLYSVVLELATLVESVKELRASLPSAMETRGSYVSSSSYMTSATGLTLEKMSGDLQQLHGRFGRLLSLFESRLHVRPARLHHLPAPSAAFLHTPVYQRIYTQMRQWFALRPVNGEDLHFVRTFLQITTLYEVYILSKLLHFFEDWGFELTGSRQIHYELDNDAFYKNTEINNVFVLEKEELKATIYYQPLIPDGLRGNESPCHLYRAISLSYPRAWTDPSHGRYYTPDYVIRLEHPSWKGARYILADAKYATWKEVMDYKIIPLSYKYLFSLAPEEAQDQISGLFIFHGKRAAGTQEPFSLLTSAYDLLQNPHSRFPQVEVLSFYEYAGTRESEQFDALRRLFSLQIEQAAKDSGLPAESELQA